jgi:hypothetical protein
MQHFLDLFISINFSTCFGRFLWPSSGAQNCTWSIRYCQNNTAAIVDEMELHPWSSISSMIAAGSSIGLTISDAVCTFLCSWWWVEKPPETCIAIYRNKNIEKTSHLFGCTLEIYLRSTDIWMSRISSNMSRCNHHPQEAQCLSLLKLLLYRNSKLKYTVVVNLVVWLLHMISGPSLLVYVCWPSSVRFRTVRQTHTSKDLITYAATSPD